MAKLKYPKELVLLRLPKQKKIAIKKKPSLIFKIKKFKGSAVIVPLIENFFYCCWFFTDGKRGRNKGKEKRKECHNLIEKEDKKNVQCKCN